LQVRFFYWTWDLDLDLPFLKRTWTQTWTCPFKVDLDLDLDLAVAGLVTSLNTTTDCDQNGQSLLTGISSDDTSVVRRELRKLHARWLTRNVALRLASCLRTRLASQYRLDSTGLIWQTSKKHWCRRTN